MPAPIDVARKMVEVAADRQAADIVLLDVREVCSFADYFIICSGETERQIQAIQSAIEEAVKREGTRFYHWEGTADSGWVLLDFGAVIVHIFAPMERDYYQLDRLWDKARLMVKVQ